MSGRMRFFGKGGGEGAFAGLLMGHVSYHKKREKKKMPG